MPLSDRQAALLDDLRTLHRSIREEVLLKHRRMNPFYEDLFDWKERGEAWTKTDLGVTLYNSATVIGDVEIGRDTWVGPFTLLDGSGGLSIGQNCSISTGSQLLSHDTVRWALSGGSDPYEYAATSIGDFCFIGSHAVVTKGVSIGSHCVVGAGCVVTADVEERSIVTGVPGRVTGRVERSGDGRIILTHLRNG